MPKRTNPFQDLVHLIELAFVKKGEKITVSAMVKPEGLEALREIDVLRETPQGLRTIRVAVEAKDEKRRMDLITFDSYCGKYFGEGRVAVDRVVLVTRRGFTRPVKEKARL